MSRAELVERIEALPAEKALRVEAFVSAIEHSGPDAQFPRRLLEEITAFRENLRATHGTLPDSCTVIRELRENGF